MDLQHNAAGAPPSDVTSGGAFRSIGAALGDQARARRRRASPTVDRSMPWHGQGTQVPSAPGRVAPHLKKYQ
jgi:hypothetical protein